MHARAGNGAGTDMAVTARARAQAQVLDARRFSTTTTPRRDCDGSNDLVLLHVISGVIRGVPRCQSPFLFSIHENLFSFLFTQQHTRAHDCGLPPRRRADACPSSTAAVTRRRPPRPPPPLLTDDDSRRDGPASGSDGLTSGLNVFLFSKINLCCP
jgi:hypothetical protein